MSLIENNLKKLNIILPNPKGPVGVYVATKIVGNLLFISGQVSIDKDAKLITCVQDKPELGLVGTPKDVNPEVIFNLFENDMIPVIAPLGSGIDGETLNVNGDTVSGAIAAALKADRLLLLTDVTGVQDEDGSIITELNSNQIKNWINEGIISAAQKVYSK